MHFKLNFYTILIFIFFLDFYCFSQENTIKSIRVHGAKNKTQKFNYKLGESINVSFDDLGIGVNDYYYSLVHCDYNWVPSNLFKNEYLVGMDDIRIVNYKKSFNTLQNYTNYNFKFPNNNFTIKLGGNYLLKVKNRNDELIFERKIFLFNKLISGSIEISRAKKINLIQTHQNLKVKFYCNGCIFDSKSDYKLIVFQNSNLNKQKIINQPTYKTGSQLIYDNLVFEGGNEFYNFDTKNIFSSNSEIKSVSINSIYETILYNDFKQKSYSFNPDINGEYLINSTSLENNVESDYTRVHFSYHEKLDSNQKIYLVGAFNNFELSNKYELKKSENLYKISLKLKQGFYNYSYIIEENGLYKNNTNFWQTENDYYAILYEKKLTERFYNIIGFLKKSSDNIVN